jgi:hypothetical protein
MNIPSYKEGLLQFCFNSILLNRHIMEIYKYIISLVGLLLIISVLIIACIFTHVNENVLIAALVAGTLLFACPIIIYIKTKWGEIATCFSKKKETQLGSEVESLHNLVIHLGEYNDDRINNVRIELIRGDIPKAISLAGGYYNNDSKYIDCYVHTLAMSTESSDTLKAEQLINKCNDPHCYSRMGYRFFCNHEYQKAINVSKTGLSLAEKNHKDNEAIRKLKNNIACYYAYLHDVTNMEMAFVFASEALQIALEHKSVRYIIADTYDTNGFVHMQYANTNAEILVAHDYFINAYNYGLDINLLHKRMKELNAKENEIEKL